MLKAEKNLNDVRTTKFFKDKNTVTCEVGKQAQKSNWPQIILGVNGCNIKKSHLAAFFVICLPSFSDIPCDPKSHQCQSQAPPSVHMVKYMICTITSFSPGQGLNCPSYFPLNPSLLPVPAFEF